MHQDFKELLSAFNAGQVLLAHKQGVSVFHAQPRATKHLDILIGADAENSKAVYAALAKFGAPIEGMSAQDFADPDNFFRMGKIALPKGITMQDLMTYPAVRTKDWTTM